MAEKAANRWIVVLGALMIQICLGALYIWSVFKVPLIQQFGWEAASVSLAFSINVLVGAVSFVFAGRLQDVYGPRWVATTGGVLLALGMVLLSRINSITQLYITFGLIAGMGISFGYVCPLATCVKWFPDKKGFMTGLAVAGFGLGATLFTPIANYLKSTVGLMPTFAYLGITYGVFVVIGAQLLKVPPPGYRPAGWNPPVTVTGETMGTDFTTRGMLKTTQFYLMWVAYLFGTAAGLMIIANAMPIATVQGLTGALAASAVMIISLFNAAGRIIWGTISDRLGRTKVLKIIFLICGVTMLSLKMLTGIMILIGVALVGFCFGGFLAVYPSLTADYFGTKSYGANYGCIFLAYGTGAVAGPMLYDLIKSPVPGMLSSTPMVVSGVACLIGLVLMFILKPPNLEKAISKQY